MSRNIRVSVFALVLVASSVEAATLQVGTCVVTPYATIQSAVNAASANDTIDVCPGTYPELVTVNKTLTLLGAQDGVDPRPGTRTGLPATESVVTGNAGTTSFSVTANDVVIDGFTIQGNTNANQFGAGVVFGPGTNGTELRHNIIQNNIVGVFVANNSASNQAVIQRNVIRNNNNPGPASGSGIYSDQFAAGGTLQNVLIDQNTFTGHSAAGASILLSSTNTAQPATNITVSNNLFTGEPRALVGFNLTSSSIINNTMENSTFVGSADLRLFEGVSGLTITGNTMRNGAGRALRVSNAGTGAPNATNITFNQNSVTGYTGGPQVFEVDAGQYTGTLNAECNWWGSATGPTHPSNPGGTGQSVSDGVDFKPWLDAAPPSGVCLGGAVIVATQGTPQSAQINTAYASPLQATVTIDGTPVSGASVTFTAPSSGASGTFAGSTTVITNGSGIATAPTFTANGIPGSFAVTATAGSSLSTSFTLTNIALPSISIGDSSLTEGNGGTTNMSFTITLSGPAVGGESVQWATAPGSAGAGTDYQSSSGVIDFSLGVTSRTINVAIVGDPDVEPDETFVINLSAPVGATISDNQATGTIVNDDVAQANLSISKGAPASAGSGAQFTYVIRATNNGPAAATNVVVTDPLPFPASASASTASQGSCGGTTTITCNLGTLAAGASATITISVSTPLTFEGSLTNTATVAAAEADPVQTDNSANVVTAIAQPVAVPTTTEWGLIILMVALATIGAWRLRP